MRRRRTPVDKLRGYLQLGIEVMVAAALGFYQLPRFLALLESNAPEAVFASILFAVTCAWFVGWVYFDHRELELFDEHFEPDALANVQVGLLPFLSAIAIALAGGALLWSSDKPYLYAFLAAVVIVVAATAYDYTRRRIEGLHSDCEAHQTGGAQLICEYYLNRRRFFTLDFLALASLATACLIGVYTQFSSETPVYYVSYGLCIATVAVHEGIIWYWRANRDKAIGELQQPSVGKASVRSEQS